MNIKNKLLIMISGVIILILITVGISYAYFSANLSGGEDSTTITVTGGTMNIIYNGGANINVANLIPSDNPVTTKIFTVTGNNTTDVEMKYQLSLVIESNTFSYEALKYKLISINTGSNGTVVPSINTLTNIGSGAKIIGLGVGEFASPTNGNKVHTYTLEIYFPNASYNQNIDQEKEINGYIKIENYVIISNLLTEAILIEGGGKTAIEAKESPVFWRAAPNFSTYKEVTNTYTSSMSSNNNRIIGSGYTFNESNGLYTLINYLTDKSYGQEHINWYTCNNSSYSDCSTLYKINTVSGTSITNSTRYQAEGATYNYSDMGLFAGEDEYGTSYYYRGINTELNNNLIFGGFQWKIIRINGDGSVRIIYNGTESQFNTNGAMNTTGTNTQIRTDMWEEYWEYDVKYVGYMYGGNKNIASTVRNGITSVAATYNETSSYIKEQLDNWYVNNILNKGLSKEIVDNIFCNDRQLKSEVGGGSTGLGYGNSETTYAADQRLNQKIGPNLKCGLKNDRFTVSNSTLGNAALTYPIGLITGDEAAMAGLKYVTKNLNNYLYTNQDYWTMSPSYLISTVGPSNFYTAATGGLYSGSVLGNGKGVRPVINLSPETIVTGDGTATRPYRVI